VFASAQRTSDNGVPWFSFSKADRRVTCFYFYLWAADFGPAFIKICAYLPYPIKVWLNGHEWAKRQATRAGIGFTELSNGLPPVRIRPRCRPSVTGWARARSGVFRTLDEAAATAADRAARRGLVVGAVHAADRSFVEVSRTLVFDAARQPARSSKPWSPTISTSAARTVWN
jgi:hypothetical protein